MLHQMILMDDTNKKTLWNSKYIIYKILKIELCKFVFFMNRKDVFFVLFKETPLV